MKDLIVDNFLIFYIINILFDMFNDQSTRFLFPYFPMFKFLDSIFPGISITRLASEMSETITGLISRFFLM